MLQHSGPPSSQGSCSWGPGAPLGGKGEEAAGQAEPSIQGHLLLYLFPGPEGAARAAGMLPGVGTGAGESLT